MCVMKQPLSRNLAVVCFALLAVFVAFCLYSSIGEINIGITPDSVEYLYAAKTFGAGEGLKSIYGSATHIDWYTHYPPGVPVVYDTVASVFHAHSLLSAVRGINTGCFLLNAGLIAWLCYLGTRNLWMMLMLACFALLSTDSFSIYQMCWSEPLFFTWVFLSLYFLHRYLDTGAWTFLLLSAITVAVACMFRYLGLTLILTGCFAILFQGGLSLLPRLFRSACYGLLSSSLLLLWFMRNYHLQNTMAHRHIAFHPMDGQYLHDVIHSIKSAYLQADTGPATEPLGVLFALGLLVFLVWICWRQGGFLRQRSLPRVLTLFGIVYCLFLVVSNTFFDLTPLYFRIMHLPFLCFLLVAGMYIAFRQQQPGARKRPPAWVLALCGSFLLLHAVTFYNFRSAAKAPDGYNTESWRHSETVAFLRSIDKGQHVYSTEPDALYALTGKRVASSDFLESDYLADKRATRLLVMFKEGRTSGGFSYNLPVPANMFERVQLLKELPDGKIYELTGIPE